MRTIALGIGLTLAMFSAGCGGSTRTVSADGVRVNIPSGWHVVRPAQPFSDPRTLLVVGTAGVAAKSSGCEIASYRIPARGAVVVVVGWRTLASAGGTSAPGRGPLKKLVSVTRPSFECFSGRGAGASVTLAGKAYQVNVMVGDRASKGQVSKALAVARSFDVVRA
jgi:hypothetical protein